ncbi:MAG: flagellar hook-length control protein FliK [Gammaproteobacteria bacterium]|nr:flagellar hook-length control protein FliK [Gammaproteobacteria bacterium]
MVSRQERHNDDGVGGDDMNQTILINNTRATATKTSAGVYANNASQQGKTHQSNAFSSELDKHVEKPNTVSSKADRDVKKSETTLDKGDTKAEKSENAIDEAGNKLPDAHVDAEQTAENPDQDVMLEDKIIAETVMASTDTDDEIIPQGLIHTQTLHDVVHAIKQTVVDSDETSQKATVGKRVSDTVKNMTKPTNAGATAVQNTLVDGSEPIKKTVTTVEKETNPTTLKLRPDISQALSLRGAGVKEQANVNAGDNAKFDAIFDKNSATAKTINAELLEHASSKTRAISHSPAVDKLGLGVSLVTLNQANGVGQVKAEVPVLDIQPSLHNAAWSRVMTSRVLWMAREGVQQASLKLNPAQLGPVEVRLNMQNEQANISFIAQNATTRDALEQAIPRLRESFAQNGLELANADVSQQSFGQSAEQEQQEKELNSASISQNVSQVDDNTSEHEQKIVDNEQDVELGLSIYA